MTGVIVGMRRVSRINSSAYKGPLDRELTLKRYRSRSDLSFVLVHGC